ncbi:MAG: hypothetical protein RL745_977 [Actinomycetota bacterium]|jgi:hypothetical protein
MKQMRNKRTGRTAVFDAELVAGGNWEPVEDQQPAQSGKPFSNDEVAATDTVEISVKRKTGESIKRKA